MIEITWEWIAVIIGLSASLGGAINHFVEIFRTLKKPRNEMRGSIENLATRLDSHIVEDSKIQAENERRFKNDHERMKRIETEARLILTGQLTLINAAIDGNHIDELKQRRDAINTYLIQKG